MGFTHPTIPFNVRWVKPTQSYICRSVTVDTNIDTRMHALNK